MKTRIAVVLLVFGLLSTATIAQTPGEMALSSNLVVIAQVAAIGGNSTVAGGGALINLEVLSVLKGALGSQDYLPALFSPSSEMPEITIGGQFLFYLTPVSQNREMVKVNDLQLYAVQEAIPYPETRAMTVNGYTTTEDTMLEYSLLTATAQEDGVYTTVLMDYISKPINNPARTTAIYDLVALSDRWKGPMLSGSQRQTIINALKSQPYGDPLKTPLIRILGNARASEAVADITLALRGKGGEVASEEAGIALHKIGDSSAVGLLQSRMAEFGPYTRANVATAMGYYGNPNCVPSLIAGLNDKFEFVRINCIYALGLIGDARAAQPLIALYPGYDFDGKKLILQSLAWIKSPIAFQFVKDRMLNDPNGAIKTEARFALQQPRPVAE